MEKYEKLQTIEITSSLLKKLNGATKDLINYGIWFLYEVDYPINKNVKYLLSTDKQDMLLAEDGGAIGIRQKGVELKYKSIINFDDIPKPEPINLAEKIWA